MGKYSKVNDDRKLHQTADADYAARTHAKTLQRSEVEKIRRAAREITDAFSKKAGLTHKLMKEFSAMTHQKTVTVEMVHAALLRLGLASTSTTSSGPCCSSCRASIRRPSRTSNSCRPSTARTTTSPPRAKWHRIPCQRKSGLSWFLAVGLGFGSGASSADFLRIPGATFLSRGVLGKTPLVIFFDCRGEALLAGRR